MVKIRYALAGMAVEEPVEPYARLGGRYNFTEAFFLIKGNISCQPVITLASGNVTAVLLLSTIVPFSKAAVYVTETLEQTVGCPATESATVESIT